MDKKEKSSKLSIGMRENTRIVFELSPEKITFK
jgi:hypothetical protein